MSRPAPRGYAPALLVAVVIAASSCGSNPSGALRDRGAGSGGQGFPVTVLAANGEVSIPREPQRVVSLSATATEMLFAIGAGEQVVAVDATSNYPPEAPLTELSAYEPNVEAIASYEPDLVVASDDIGDLSSSLDALAIPMLLQPAAADLVDSYAQIEQLGTATGNVDGASEVVAGMRARIEEITASVPEFADPPTYYHELDQSYFTATSDTFIGHVYGLVGLRNIADRAKGAAGGYPQLSAEYILDADPDLIFLADTKCCGQNADTVASRPGWERITAVRTGAVVELDDDVASRWGPRVVDFLDVAAEAVSRLAPVGA
jgi:iron complex transport system substrate-binding protein